MCENVHIEILAWVTFRCFTLPTHNALYIVVQNINKTKRCHSVYISSFLLTLYAIYLKCISVFIVQAGKINEFKKIRSSESPNCQRKRVKELIHLWNEIQFKKKTSFLCLLHCLSFFSWNVFYVKFFFPLEIERVKAKLPQRCNVVMCGVYSAINKWGYCKNLHIFFFWPNLMKFLQVSRNRLILNGL